MDFDLTQTDHLLNTTRAVRKRLDLTRPVPRELVLDCVRICEGLVGNRAEAEDLAQEVFVKLYKHTSRRRIRWPGKQQNISAWLYRVATNSGYDALKTRKRRWQRDTLLVPDPQGAPGAEQSVAGQEEQVLVRTALSRLPQRQAQLLLLRQMGFSYAECAAACDVAPGSVGTLLSRAAAAFRKEYEELVR